MVVDSYFDGLIVRWCVEARGWHVRETQDGGPCEVFAFNVGGREGGGGCIKGGEGDVGRDAAVEDEGAADCARAAEGGFYGCGQRREGEEREDEHDFWV